MAELVELSGTHGPLTAEQAETFKRDLAELVRQGAGSVPAIREFLERNLEFNYANIPGGDQLGFPSLRAGLIDTLRQIGGPEAQGALAQVLQTSASPSELLEVAKILEQQAPGAYRDQTLNSVRETLSMASANQLGTNVELGPAFRLLQAYNNSSSANSIDDAARTDPGKFLDAVTMANLPDGQGLPGLVQMAESPGGSQTIATEMIAQLAGQNADARQALVQMAQQGQIPNSVWVKVAPVLGGDQYQMVDGGRNYTVVDGATSPDQINQRIALIDQLLGMVGQDSAAAKALANQRGILAGKLGRTN